ncbi:MAG: DUF6155 family protein [Agitococcus sp.]
MSLTTLKKTLAEKSQTELIKEIAELYTKFPNVKEYYSSKLGNPLEVLNKYQDIIKKEFVYGTTKGFPKARLSVAKKAIQDFKKLSNDPKLIADIHLTFVESVSNFNTEFSPNVESFYESPENVFGDILATLKKQNLLLDYQQRAYLIVKNATQGWGHFDTLCEHYENYYGNFE